MNKFPCTGCGSCCRRISVAVSHYNVTNKRDPLYFPYKWDENGVCENLTQDNKCKVYENRPLLCDVERFAKHMKVNREDFFLSNIRACNYLMELDNVPSEFRINLTNE